MRISYTEWMKNPAKWMKKAAEYHHNMNAARERFQRWAHTPEGQDRIKAYLEKQGYAPDENG